MLQLLQLLLFLKLLLLLGAELLFFLERHSFVVFCIGLFGGVALFDHSLWLHLIQVDLILKLVAIRLSVGAF